MKTELLISGLFLLTIFMPTVARADNSVEAAIIFQSGTEVQTIARHNKITINTTTQAAVERLMLIPCLKI